MNFFGHLPCLPDVQDRVIFAAKHISAQEKNKYLFLEQRTGISARRWKNVCYKTNNVSVEMAVALASIVGDKIFSHWILTGISDEILN